ncbi:MAG TPA: transcription elongation factor GreA [Fredinandcohnia sp.]|nr:transcription elongation factor GreA [Fredinandcohnia sp.]
MSDKIPMTRSGQRKLLDELKRLKTVDRPNIVREIEEARAHGDLSENAEYKFAKEKQGHIEGRIQQVEDWLARAEVIDVSRLGGDKVVFGATVTLLDVDTDKTVKYRIVGEIEADLKQGLISVNSPLARSLIGREVGDEVVVRTPGGERTYEILEIGFEDEEEPPSAS